MTSVYDNAVEAATFIQSKTDYKAEIAVILGSGLGDFANEIQDSVAISYSDIPHFK